MKWLVSALLLLALGAAAQWGLLVFAMYALLALIGLSRFFANRWIASLTAERSPLPAVVEAGARLPIEITLHNRSSFHIPWILAEEILPAHALHRIPPALRLTGSRLALLDLKAGGTDRFTYELHLERRGYFQIGPLLLEGGDVFGLHRRFRVVDEPRFVTVLPKVLPLQGYDIASRRPMGEIRLTHRQFEDPTRIAGVRAYQHGDPMTRIHWRATARTGTLQSKLLDPTSLAGATFLLDLHQNGYSGRGGAAQLELAITTVASLAHALEELGDPFGLITNGRDAADRARTEGFTLDFLHRDAARRQTAMHDLSDRLQPVILETRRGLDHLQHLHETLGRLETTDGFPLADLIPTLTGRLPRQTTLVAVLPTVDPPTALLLGTLRRQGISVLALLILFDEPDLSDWAEPPDWAASLLAERVPFRRISTEEDLMRWTTATLLGGRS